MNNIEAIDKLEPSPLFTNPNNMILDNIKNVILRSDNCWDRAKDQIKGAVTAYSHSRELNTRRLTLEHLRFVLQEIEAVPYKQLKNDLRIIIAQLEKEKRERVK